MTYPNGTPDSTQVRASDAEREEFARIVRDAIGEGRLTLAEGDERLAQVYAARYRDDLRPLVADLPTVGTVEPARRAYQSGGRRSLDRQDLRPYLPALAFLLLVVVLLIGPWILTGGRHGFVPAFPLVFIGFMLLRHGRWARRQ